MTISRREVLRGGVWFAAAFATQSAAQPPTTGTRLVLLGTQGGPNYTAARGECASALIINGEPLHSRRQASTIVRSHTCS